MALPYEQLSEDLRRTERLKRQRAREAWKRETALQKYLYNLGTVTALALEDQEDNVLRLVALEAEGKSVLLAGMRRTAKDLLEIYSQINAANIYDFNLVEQRFGGKTSVEGLSDEKQKFLSKPYKGEGVCLELDPDFLHFTGGVFPGDAGLSADARSWRAGIQSAQFRAGGWRYVRRRTRYRIYFSNLVFAVSISTTNMIRTSWQYFALL